MLVLRWRANPSTKFHVQLKQMRGLIVIRRRALRGTRTSPRGAVFRQRLQPCRRPPAPHRRAAMRAHCPSRLARSTRAILRSPLSAVLCHHAAPPTVQAACAWRVTSAATAVMEHRAPASSAQEALRVWRLDLRLDHCQCARAAAINFALHLRVHLSFPS
jgi:hypothetical protein